VELDSSQRVLSPDVHVELDSSQRVLSPDVHIQLDSSQRVITPGDHGMGTCGKSFVNHLDLLVGATFCPLFLLVLFVSFNSSIHLGLVKSNNARCCIINRSAVDYELHMCTGDD